MNDDKPNDREVDALPTKELFISMLTKDLVLEDAIGDLVDNCVDGARRIQSDGDFRELWVRIEAAHDQFMIEDNCGGIPVDLARKYAFRFGRPSGMEPIPRSVGQFGIGMKRALFKLGRNFRVESTSEHSHFVVDVDVPEWRKEERDWTFKFEKMEKDGEKVNPPDQWRTTITVTKLFEEVQEQFGLENYISALIKELRYEHLHNIDRGLSIEVNGKLLDAPSLQVLESEEISPGYWEHTYSDDLEVRIIAGIGEHNLDDGGWYIFGNDRLILGPEQTAVSGWGWSSPVRIPKYHGQYARFRGFAFFGADDASLLPLNTAKTNMDLDSPRFKDVRRRMIKLARPAIDFLNDVHQEQGRLSSGDADEDPLNEAIELAKLVPISSIDLSPGSFTAPKSQPTAIRATGRISYSKPLDEIRRVQEALRVDTKKAAGEGTFEYYLQMEVED